MQAYDMSRDHKPDLEAEKQRISNAGGYVRCGRVNGSLNMARAIGIKNIAFSKIYYKKYSQFSFFPLCYGKSDHFSNFRRHGTQTEQIIACWKTNSDF